VGVPGDGVALRDRVVRVQRLAIVGPEGGGAARRRRDVALEVRPGLVVGGGALVGVDALVGGRREVAEALHVASEEGVGVPRDRIALRDRVVGVERLGLGALGDDGAAVREGRLDRVVVGVLALVGRVAVEAVGEVAEALHVVGVQGVRLPLHRVALSDRVVAGPVVESLRLLAEELRLRGLDRHRAAEAERRHDRSVVGVLALIGRVAGDAVLEVAEALEVVGVQWVELPRLRVARGHRVVTLPVVELVNLARARVDDAHGGARGLGELAQDRRLLHGSEDALETRLELAELLLISHLISLVLGMPHLLHLGRELVPDGLLLLGKHLCVDLLILPCRRVHQHLHARERQPLVLHLQKSSVHGAPGEHHARGHEGHGADTSDRRHSLPVQLLW